MSRILPTNKTSWLANAIALSLALAFAMHVNNSAAWTLSDTCPAGFLPDDEGLCRLNSQYRNYPSLRDAGVGGLRTGLPPVRDGFTPQQIDLGRYLFFDPLLSGDGSLACSSCHDPKQGFSDGRGRSLGMAGQELPRSSPSLWNVGLLQRFFWDGRATTLEEQVQGPLYNDKEMANNPARLLASLRDNEDYRGLFADAFAADDIELEHIYTALVAFEASLVSLNSRYDLYAHGYYEALTGPEIEGLNVFRSFVARCAECHTPPTFTNQQIAVLGTPEPEGMPRDIGAEGPTGDPSQRGGFRVPSLRNIAKTAPYMHSGRFATLREAVAFYTGGRGHAVPEGEKLYLHWHVWEPNLSDKELDRLVDFLGALTDEGFMPTIPDQVPSGLPAGGIRMIEKEVSKR